MKKILLLTGFCLMGFLSLSQESPKHGIGLNWNNSYPQGNLLELSYYHSLNERLEARLAVSYGFFASITTDFNASLGFRAPVKLLPKMDLALGADLSYKKTKYKLSLNESTSYSNWSIDLPLNLRFKLNTKNQILLGATNIETSNINNKTSRYWQYNIGFLKKF